MKRVLIITYYWPPSGGSGVQRWLKFAKYLPQLGWEPVIYTPLNPEPNAIDEALCREIPEGMTVLKRKIFEPYSLYKFLSGKKRGETIEANIISKESGGSASARLFAFIRGNFFIPDPRCFWIRPSARFLKRYLRKNPVDAIISTGPPHSMHLIAARLSRAAKIKWIADFRDPWTKIFYFKHLPLTNFAKKRHGKLEKEVL
ncbi:MAG: glycosyl transferase family 1, partial [Bacteroidetes bacterium]|nr:glycosyl transferase family 1 [Candidatus Egerieousia excrementavium]